VPDLCHAVLNLLVDGTGGLWHIANPGSLSWFEFAQRLAEEAGADTSKLVPISGEASDTTLVSVHGALLRPVDAAISDYCRNFAQIEETFREQPAPSQRGGMDGRL